LVEDISIAEAQHRLWAEFSVIAEPGGAAAFATIASGAYQPERDERVGVLVCGSNADLTAFAKMIAAGASPEQISEPGDRLLYARGKNFVKT